VSIYSTNSTKEYIRYNSEYKGIFLSVPSGKLGGDEVISSKIV